MSPSRQRTSRNEGGDVLQRAVAAASLLLVLVIFAYLGWQALIQDPLPPHVTVDVVGFEGAALPYRVEFVARNSGTVAAANVQIEGSLVMEDRVVERATATLDYVPGRASRRGALFFHSPFTREQLRVRALGYVDP